MEKLRIGIDASSFCGWGGGIDFIAMIAEALESTGKVQTFLIIGKDSIFGILWNGLSFIKRTGFHLKKYKINKRQRNVNIMESFHYCSPNTKPIFYKKTETRIINNREKQQLKCLKKNKIDIIMPSMYCDSEKFSVPRIGYIYDFQHKYFPDFFNKKEIYNRNKLFQRQLKNSKYLIVNAWDVAKDIKKFYPNEKCKIIVLPFKPFQKSTIEFKPEIEKYHLPDKYYIICNQFWMHKSHITAFEALEQLYRSGKRDIHIVCTGKMEDTRNRKFIDNLQHRIDTMECRKNIHLLGYIPKDDQIAIMKKAVGLIQPTLFEGGPGGGSTYNALCLGITCLLSDIPVNREVIGYDNVFFFERENVQQLAQLMEAHRNDTPIEEEILKKRVESNRKAYGEFLIAKLENIIAANK